MFRQKRFDFFLLLPILFLVIFGFSIIASVAPNNLPSHLIYLAVSLLFFFLLAFVDLEIFLPFAPLLYVFNIVFLILPFLLGTVTRGAVRWIPIGSYTIQPSEIAKPFIALFAAWFWRDKDFNYKNLLYFVLFCSPALLLVFFQPDLGSTLVVLSMLIGVVFFSGLKAKQVLIFFFAFLLALPIFWFSLRDFQKMRVVHFINPNSDPLGEGYNLIQAKIAVGSGGFFGRGLGKGTQSHLAFLPERHTDFIFASLSEELGFVGSFAVVLLYLLLLARILKIAGQVWAQKGRKLQFLLTLALFCGLFFQTTVNIGMNIGLMPITGVTLPLVSYGGSSLLATMISLGIVENISRNNTDRQVVLIK